MKPSIGERLGQYRLEQLAGRGSMADVYQARHVDTGERVAVKLMHPHLIQQPSALRRFRREAEVMLKVRHPHIAQIYDCVAEAETAYIVMEYLAGGTLEERLAEASLKHGGLPLEQIDRWMTTICAAVDYAHRHGLVHRDLKPANIMFRDDDAPVLTDFGLAYWVDQPRLSGTGSLTGTPAYISPEQARGQAGDRRSDVYSLGVILYEMLTGQTPFQGGTLGVVVKHISELPPAPRVFGRKLHPNVEAVVMRTLAKEPVERYQSAQSLAAALHLAIHKRTGLVTFHSPVILSSFSEYTQEHFRRALFEPKPLGRIANPPERNPVRPQHPWRAVRPGKARGRLIGGNLTLISTTLGTPYEIQTEGKILFLEDVGEEPYSIDRMLTHLRLAGKFRGIRGLVWGECAACRPRDFQPGFESTFSTGEVVQNILGALDVPVLTGLVIGHTDDQLTLPLGVEAELDADAGTLTILESALTE